MRPKIPLKLAKRFRHVCPEWSKRLLDGPDDFDYDFPYAVFTDNNGKQWSLKQTHGCIVSEAHDRHVDHGPALPSYGCETCVGFSMNLMDILDSHWPTILRKFLNHYDKIHIKGMPA